MKPVPGVADAAPRHYAAFISYSHCDRKWAEWLHRAIETYRVPKGLSAEGRGGLRDPDSALRPVFLDREELPSSADLAESVRGALQYSDVLIVICSPDAARSRWVNEEVRVYKEAGRAARILCLIVRGEPAAEPADSADCFPPALRYVVEGGRITDRRAGEPLAADVRPGKDKRRMAQLKIVAGILQVPLDRLRHREQLRLHRRIVLIAAASVIGCVCFGALAVVALRARDEAVGQRRLAEQQTLTARRTADFLKSLFVVSDPSEARGNTISAREVLDRGVRQVSEQLKDEPLMRADLTTTLGEVYASLGLLKDAERLLLNARSVPAQPEDLAARQAVALGEVLYQRGDYDAALQALSQASTVLDQMSLRDVALQARQQLVLGDIFNRRDDYAGSRRYFQSALAAASGDATASGEVRARALEGVAQADLYEDRLDQALDGFHKALEARIAFSGELHPRTAEILNELGTVEYLRGHSDSAVGYFRKTLAIDRRILGEHNPELAGTLNNLARVLLEQRRFGEARELLVESMTSRSAEVVTTEDDMAFVYSNLALADMGLGKTSAAEPLLQKALRAAIANKHRLHGPILTDLADLECRTRRYRAGLQRLDEARPIVQARYPDDPWRVAHVDNVRAGCLTGAGRYGEADRLMRDSLGLVLKKWPADTFYGHDALERAVRLYSGSGDADKVARYSQLLQRDKRGGAQRF